MRRFPLLLRDRYNERWVFKSPGMIPATVLSILMVEGTGAGGAALGAGGATGVKNGVGDFMDQLF